MTEIIEGQKSVEEKKPESSAPMSAEDLSDFDFHTKVGGLDPLGRRIEEIYYTLDGKYFIYHIGNYNLEIVAEDGSLLSQNAKANEIYCRITDYFRSNPGLNEKYIRSVAFAVKTLYDGNSEIAITSLEATYNSITRSMKRKAEAFYIGGAIILVLLNPIIYLITYRFGNLSELGHILFCAIIFSALGGFLSIALNVKNLDVDVQNLPRVIMAYGAQRIFIAMISGVFIYFLIASEIFLAFFKNLQNVSIYYVAFFLCGFIERLVPNLMLTLEENGMLNIKKA